MTTYAPIMVPAEVKTAIMPPGADAYITGSRPWFISDTSDDDAAARGIKVPAHMPYRITSGAQKYAYADRGTVLTMVDV